MESELPGGTVTFLFTDIEGSTRLWDAFPDEMRQALSMHNRVMADAVEANRGHLVKNTGDGMFAAFSSAPAAVAAAVAAQRMLGTAEWPVVVGSLGVRMALHTATIEPSGGDYHGPDVNRVARIEAAGHGGQILLSSTTHALVAHGLPSDTESVDLGTHLLRGLSEPERIRQLSVTGLRTSFPPLRTGSTIDAHLPTPPTSFVGRDEELRELADMLSDGRRRLITLLGPGGIGKTRLSIEAARRVAETTGIPAHFFSLDGIMSSSDVIKALGDSIGFTFDIHISATISEQTQLFDRLRAQPLLLVLDNLEHLPDIAGLIAEMLDGIPTLTILATSRRRLDLSSEWKMEVRGLDDHGLGDAISLFVDRAAQAGATVQSDGPDGAAIAALCSRLGGMPLAIELAAAWAGMLSPVEIAKEIELGLDFLESSSQDTPDRHRSVRTVFDHSWNRLPEKLQQVYARLAVFVAPFDRTAAGEVAGASLADLMTLSKQSLIMGSGHDRFALHPLLREFAAEELGDDRESAMKGYARYYWQFLTDRAQMLAGGVDQIAARDEVADELDHLRAVTGHWIGRYSDADMVTALRALESFYFIHSWVDERSHFERIVELYEASTPASRSTPHLWAKTLLGLTVISFLTPDEIAAVIDPVEEDARRVGRELAAYWLLVKGIELTLRNDYQSALEYFDQAQEYADDLSALGFGHLMAWRGWAHLQLGDNEQATSMFRRGLEVVEPARHELIRAFLLSKSGLAADAAGDHDEAERLHHEGREIFLKSGDLGGQGYTLSRLSWTSYLKGDFDAACRYALEALAMFEEINHRWGIAVSYGRLGLAEIELGRSTDAAEHFLICLEKATESGLPDQQHYAVTGIGRTLLAAGAVEQAVRILAAEAAAERNPYKDLAVGGLASLPEDPGTPEVEFDELIAEAKTAATRLIESG